MFLVPKNDLAKGLLRPRWIPRPSFLAFVGRNRPSKVLAMGRRKKTGKDERTKRLPHVRCTLAEYDAAFNNAKNAGLSLSAYVRDLAVTGKAIVANDAPEKRQPLHFEIAFQLQKIGVNLNQLTRVAHATGGELPRALKDAGDDLQLILDRILQTVEFE